MEQLGAHDKLIKIQEVKEWNLRVIPARLAMIRALRLLANNCHFFKGDIQSPYSAMGFSEATYAPNYDQSATFVIGKNEQPINKQNPARALNEAETIIGEVCQDCPLKRECNPQATIHQNSHFSPAITIDLKKETYSV